MLASIIDAWLSTAARLADLVRSSPVPVLLAVAAAVAVFSVVDALAAER